MRGGRKRSASFPSGEIGGAERGDLLPVEIALEVRDHGGQFAGSFDGAEQRTGGKDGLHLGEVIGVISAEIDGAAGDKRGMGERGKAGVDEAMTAVFALGPRIRKVDVEGRHRAGGQKPFQQIGSFDAQGPGVGQTGALAFAVQLAQASKETLDAEEIALGMERGVSGEERAITAAEFDLQRLKSGKKSRKIETLGHGLERNDDGRRRGQGLSRRN